MIEEIKRYTDEKGKSVKAYVPHPVLSTNFTRYEGTVGIQAPAGIMPIDFPFPADYTLEQCFENFEDIANKEVKKIIEAEKEKSRIITPSQAGGNSQGLKVLK